MKNSFLIFIFSLTTLIFISSGSISAQTYRYQSKGIYNLSELHIGYGLQGEVEPNEIGFAGLSTLAGYTFTKRLAAGIGAGFLAYNGSNAVPVYLEGGYYFKDFGIGKMRFFIKADAGLLIRLNGDISPTRYFGNPAAGLLIPVASHKELSVSFGVFTQWDPDNADNTQQNQLTNFINAKIGLRLY
jgi:hypothetical protein